MNTGRKIIHDLSALAWTVAGWRPHTWRLTGSPETGGQLGPFITAVAAPVPGSVQQALKQAGLLPDWNVGLNASLCEWVENRDWIYEAALPDAWFEGAPGRVRLHCFGLDYRGRILMNGTEVATFSNSYVPCVIDLADAAVAVGNRIQIIFEPPPRYLGHIGYTSEVTDWKVRYNYGWDWNSRFVQVGIWDTIQLEVIKAGEIETLDVRTDADPGTGIGSLTVTGSVNAPAGSTVKVALFDGSKPVHEETAAADDFSDAGLSWSDLDVALWWPNGMGAQPLYELQVRLLDGDGDLIDSVTRQVGFKSITWQANDGAPPDADPWICVANGTPFFIAGVNWTPIRSNFADVTSAEYVARLTTYRDLGVNFLRVWGGAFLEKPCFFELCDALGLLVLQELPLSSSGLDNYPPDDVDSIDALCEIARSYISRRGHHVSLCMWSGGNELCMRPDGEGNVPVTMAHPLMPRLVEVAAERDPGRRFVMSLPCGPRFTAKIEEFGQGLHWAVNGPWRIAGTIDEGWIPYWDGDDSLIRTETGVPGPSSAELIEKYKGDCAAFPCDFDNPLWRRTPAWIEDRQFAREHGGRAPDSLEEYVTWGQDRQARALAYAVQRCKDRFPACGGIVIWMGHDSFPCTTNTALLDFDGNPKPAALAVGKIFRQTR